jgi:Ran GTPase-activating protein (RanGAP) involved in mRNA processing and transport
MLNTCITSLNLEGTAISPAGSCFLFPALTHLTALTYLNLEGTGLQSFGVDHLLSSLSRLRALKQLHLRRNGLSADHVARIHKAVIAAGMTDLSIDFCLPPELLRRIASSDPTLKSVEITRQKRLGEVGCQVLARELMLNTCITSLNLEGTAIGPAGSCILFPALTHLTALTYLNLEGAGLESAGVSHLLSSLSRLRALRELHLGRNGLSADDVDRIQGAVSAAGMTGLSINFYLPPELLQHIAGSDPTLESIEITCQKEFGEAGCQVLARELMLNTCITS